MILCVNVEAPWGKVVSVRREPLNIPFQLRFNQL